MTRSPSQPAPIIIEPGQAPDETDDLGDLEELFDEGQVEIPVIPVQPANGDGNP